ncbi:hypothetical protein PR202_gb21948 [Eleusine coracana subsp. coracana]|uniref:Uncharacterized protein n=1 Tax=Eleusine coracana subsp. coracana TaxID=191504 RepID=A0AAV5FG08_ELECO|nr:hypothetical protein PR202_gb21948 [Eleusine coracana subsp. coracana]
MLTAAGRARRILASPAASGIPGVVSGTSFGCASGAEGVLLPRLSDGVPASSSSPSHATGISSSFALQSLGKMFSPTMTSQRWSERSVLYHMSTAHFSTEANDTDHPTVTVTEAVEEQYQKMLKSVEAETMPPNAWMWSMISSCSNKEDIKLLFQILQKLRVFRLSNLRINANFNDHLCRTVTEACARVGVLDYGLKALWKHNVYGITPTIGSAHYLLQHAKEHNDTKLMENIMQVLTKNYLPLQPGTADIVFSSTPAGDSQAIWSINSLRGKSVKFYTLATGFACAKGFLLDRKPESAAAIIKLLNKHLPEQKKALIKDELQKIIAEWPSEVIKRQKKDDRKALEEALVKDIPTMINCLTNLGLDIPVDLDKLTPQLQAA